MQRIRFTQTVILVLLALLTASHPTMSFSQNVSETEHIAAADTLTGQKSMTHAQLSDAHKRHIISIITIFALSIFFIAKFFVRSINGKRRQHELLIQVETLKHIQKENYERSEDFIRENNLKMAQLEQQLNDARNMNDELARQIDKQRCALVLANEKAERDQNIRRLADHALAQSDAWECVKKCLDKGKIINEEGWNSIDSSVNDIVESFKLRLYSLCRMSEQEYHVCLLVRLGVSTSEISSLIGRSASAVS